MKDKPSFKDYVSSLKKFDRPYVYENSKTGNVYKEKNAGILRIGCQIISAVIPVIIYIIFLSIESNSNVYDKLCGFGLSIFVIVNLIIYPLRYPLIVFKKISSYEEVEKEKKRFIDAIPYIIFTLGMGYICFYVI